MTFPHTAIPNFLTKEECNTILSFSLENLKLTPSEIINSTTDGVDGSIRKSNIQFYPYYAKFPFLLKKIDKLINQYISVKGFDLDYKHKPFQFTEYNPGGHHAWHKDVYGDKITNYDRYCSLVVQLNDKYEDGELQMRFTKDETFTVEKGIGNLTLFLSDTEHRVTPVKSGVRYTLVNWVSLVEKKEYKKTLL
jgi:predicted 2-oxoglutarate/Fe(II)-dependent dioxygenase YbiX